MKHVKSCSAVYSMQRLSDMPPFLAGLECSAREELDVAGGNEADLLIEHHIPGRAELLASAAAAPLIVPALLPIACQRPHLPSG